MQNVRFSSISAIFGLLASLTYSAGQSKPPDALQQKVSVAFFANDEHGKPVRRVTQTDLEVLDDKKAVQRVLGIRGRTDVPLLLGMLIDASGSQVSSSVYMAAVKAASEFSNQVLTGPDDKAFVERFALVPEATPLLPKSQFLALRVDLNPVGRTALYDAVRFACDERMNGDTARDSLRVIVLISDGKDNDSHSDLKQAVASAHRAGAVIFAVDTGRDSYHYDMFPQTFQGKSTLRELAAETGGIAFLDLDHGSVSKTFAAIKEQIDNMHLLSYVAANPNQNAQYHSLKLNAASKTKLKLRAPVGYYSNGAHE